MSFRGGGGDFNSVEGRVKDKLGGVPYKGSGGADILGQYCVDFNLCDVYRRLYPESRVYTYHRGSVATRIDRLDISVSIFPFCERLYYFNVWIF